MIEFIAAEESTREIVKTVLLVKTLAINVLITGEIGTGKSLLASKILPDSATANGASENEIVQLLLRSDSLIIEDFDRLKHPDHLDLENKRIVATASRAIDQRVVDRFFGITLNLLPLRDRPLDVPLLAEMFMKEARAMLMISRVPNIETSRYDLSENAYSLRRSIFTTLLMESLGENDVLTVMNKFLHGVFRENAGGNIYRDYLHMYDLPLIMAGLDECGSQLKLSNVLGINRNTLRKKIHELGIGC
ncbi:MAG: sigma 54-interacting transcriptional regulator [Helicobacteraceae bacterium]|jgi:DNA-binding NtrC family response regulator|nr:sigma 54-interacting transcriptional regulator [Helicobacteraceae bacterium]